MDDHPGLAAWLGVETVTDLRAELAGLAEWQLSQERWDEVEEILARLRAALLERDREAVRVAVGDLALAGPVRTTRIGAGQLPVTEEAVERRAELEHMLVEPDPSPVDDGR